MGSEFSGQKTGQRYFSSESLKDIFDEKFIEKAGNTFTHERFSDLELRIFKEASISVREAEEYSRIGGMAIVNAIRQMIPPSSILEYADHFTTDDISDLLAMYEIEYGDLIESDGEYLYDLKLHRVFGPTLPDVANKYSPIFTGAEVCILHGHGISAKQALTYNKGKIEYIDELKARDDSVRVDKGIFSGYDIVKFTEANLSPLRANRYPTYLSADEIVWLANKNISGKMAARYYRHKPENIPFMKNHGIRPNTDPSLIQKYGLKEALYFQEHNLTEENMADYSDRFSPKEKILLHSWGIDGTIAESYDTRLDGSGIVYFYKKRISGSQTMHEERFSQDELYDLLEAGVSPEIARKYPERFCGEGIAKLFSLSVKPEDVQDLDERINSKALIRCAEKGIPFSYANELIEEEVIRKEKFFRESTLFKEEDTGYSERAFGFALALSNLYESGAELDTIRKFKYDFSLNDIGYFLKHDVGTEVNGFIALPPHWITKMFKAGVDPEFANAYIKDITNNPDEIIDFYKQGYEAQEVKQHYLIDGKEGHITANFVAFMKRLGFTISDVEGKDELVQLLFAATRQITDTDYVQALPSGNQGYLISINESVWKYSMSSAVEYRNLELVTDAPFPVYHVVTLHPESKRSHIFRMRHIKGESLETMIKEGEIEKDQVLMYGRHIYNSLEELRKAGIMQHRDIRPANIVYDQENDRMVLIDLGIATTDPSAGPRNNRGYGGQNDLVSLGQVMYKMYTGEHLFGYSPEMEQTIRRGEIKTERDWVFEKPEERLGFYFDRIDKTIENEKERAIIKECLTAGEHDYSVIKHLFNR